MELPSDIAKLVTPYLGLISFLIVPVVGLTEWLRKYTGAANLQGWRRDVAVYGIAFLVILGAVYGWEYLPTKQLALLLTVFVAFFSITGLVKYVNRKTDGSVNVTVTPDATTTEGR